MADKRKLNEAFKRWKRQDEENLLLDISEERRLDRLGIDPDAHPLIVMLELSKRQKALQKERSEKLASSAVLDKSEDNLV